MSGDADGLGTMKDRFIAAENVINDIESGKAIKDLQIDIDKATAALEQLTVEVSQLSLFSSNETVEELPTSSLPFLLLPCYLGVLHHNTMVEVEHKAEELTMAKVYYRDFLKRVKEYGVIALALPWNDNECDEEGEDAAEAPHPHKPMHGIMNGKPTMTAEDFRASKIMRFKLQREFQLAMAHARRMLDQTQGDDSYLRELYMAQLQFWATKLYEELSSIEAELPLLEMMLQRRTEMGFGAGSSQPKPDGVPLIKPLKPFIIARSEQQKKVLGLGYPAIPTLTVDEWYSQRFGNQPPAMGGPSSSNARQHSHGADEECLSGSDAEDDVDTEEKRMAAMRMDEYKDTHRRGWGNTHNKG